MGTDILRAMRERVSVRTYRTQPLSKAHIQKIETFIKQQQKPPFGTDIRFVVLDTEEGHIGRKDTFGVIRGAGTFIACILPSGGRLADLGYAFEAVVLFAQKLGIGTCWMGTFNRKTFSRAAKVKVGETLPVVSPLGYPDKKRSRADKSVRFIAGSRKRLPWERLFFNGSLDTPLTEANAGVFSEALEMVRLAPSASNRQPWRIVKEGNDTFHFYIQRSKAYIGNMLGFDIQMIDMGIALYHFEAALGARGISGGFSEEKSDIGISGEKRGAVEYVTTFREGEKR